MIKLIRSDGIILDQTFINKVQLTSWSCYENVYPMHDTVALVTYYSTNKYDLDFDNGPAREFSTFVKNVDS